MEQSEPERPSGGAKRACARADPTIAPRPLIKKHQFLNQSSNPCSATEGRMYRVFVWTAPGTGRVSSDSRKLARVNDDIR